jgi:phage terminase small subunit
MKNELTDKQELFVEHYLTCWNGSRAAKLAGYQGDRRTLAQVGYRLRKHPAIAARIQERIETLAMDADEVLIRLAQQARGEASEYIKTDGEGKPYFDIEGINAAGLSHLIKSVSFTKTGEVKAQTCDSQAALLYIGKHLKLFDSIGKPNGTLKVVVEYVDGGLEDHAAETPRRPEDDSSGSAAV